MPDLDSPMHVNMLHEAQQEGQIAKDEIYGLHWGDPQKEPHLKAIRDGFVLPYVHPDRSAIEVGPGGGRWTRYLLGFGELFVVDYHQELLDHLASAFKAPQLKFVKNSGTDFPSVPDASIDFIFTFGCFVHLELPVIEAYFDEMKRVLKPDGCAVVQYSDKTKQMAIDLGPGFGNTTPGDIRRELAARNLVILEEDLVSLPHSSIVRFGT